MSLIRIPFKASFTSKTFCIMFIQQSTQYLGEHYSVHISPMSSIKASSGCLSNAAHKGTKCFLKQPRIFEDYLYYGNYNFSYYSFFLRGYKGLKVVTICYYKYLYINIYIYYIFIYTFLYLHFKSVILGQNKTVITEIVICNRFFSGIEMHTFIAPKTMTISSQSYEL